MLKSASRRNEKLDCRIYATAALDIVSPKFPVLRQAILDRAAVLRGQGPEQKQTREVAAKTAETPKPARRGRRVLNKGIG